MSRRHFYPAILLFAGALITSAHAAGLSVSPPHVHIGAEAMSSELRIANNGESAVSMQASLTQWRQSATGEDEETETADLVIFPKLFTVQPGDVQTLRLGRMAGAPKRPPTEGSYRLMLTQLPVAAVPGQIAVLQRIRLPVWLTPAAPKADWAVSGIARTLSVAKGEGAVAMLTATVVNRGNQHVRPTELAMSALDGSGTVKSTATVAGWYVLPGSQRSFSAPMPADFCTGTQSVRVTVRLAKESRDGHWPAASVCGMS